MWDFIADQVLTYGRKMKKITSDTARKRSRGSDLGHFSTHRGTASAFLRAVSEQWMLRSMAFAGFHTRVTDLSTQCADLFGQRRKAAHPLSRKRTNVGTFTTHTSTKSHQFHIIVMVVLHLDHIIAAPIAYGGARPTSRDAILILSG